MKAFYLFVVAVSHFTGCGQANTSQPQQQSAIVKAGSNEPPECDCCVFDEVSNASLQSEIKLAADTATGERIIVEGTLFQSDGKTPAANTVMYLYQTNHTGRYAKHGNEDRSSFAWWHGYTRGFLKTDEQGHYRINTIKPAPYPGGTEPAHIHCIVKSPQQKRCYYIADFVFEDDKLLTPQFWVSTAKFWRSMGIDDDPNYGGVRLTKNKDGLLAGKRDITLFDEYDLPALSSGKTIGSESPAFSPQHVAGPDKGSHACPMCKYGYVPGVIVFLNSDEDWEQAKVLCKNLEAESKIRGSKKFKAYLVYTNPGKLSVPQLESKLSKFANALSIEEMAITYVPSIEDRETEMHLNEISPGTKNTVIVYYNRRVFDKFTNFIPTEKNLKLLWKSVDYAKLSKMKVPGNNATN